MEFEYIGWCHSGTSDKVWLGIKVNNAYYAVWGRRGKALGFKKHSFYSLNPVIRSKRREYTAVSKEKLYEIFPDFDNIVQQRLVFCLLAGKVK